MQVKPYEAALVAGPVLIAVPPVADQFAGSHAIVQAIADHVLTAPLFNLPFFDFLASPVALAGIAVLAYGIMTHPARRRVHVQADAVF